MTQEQQKWAPRLRERLKEEADARITLQLWLESEILLVKSQIEQINCPSNGKEAPRQRFVV